jgi:pimeloyl-ACP methyl ester carboxylesterase
VELQIAIDSRGQGNSIDDTTALTYDLMASDVNQLLEQLHIDSAYVWGHSDGAILALILAKDYPKRVSKAIAYAANLTPDTMGLVPVEFENIKKIVETSDNPKEKQLNTMMYKYPHIPFADLHKIEAQVLIMSGDNDMIPLAHTLEIYKNIQKSNLCILPGATHGGAWQKPKLFQEIAVDFFEKPFRK